jgi:hypothetical protein
MQVVSLSVARRPSYDSDYPNQLVGLVELKSAQGQQTLKLSNRALSNIFKVISDEVCATARDNAAAVRRGMDEAVHEPLLLQSREVPEVQVLA